MDIHTLKDEQILTQEEFICFIENEEKKGRRFAMSTTAVKPKINGMHEVFLELHYDKSIEKGRLDEDKRIRKHIFVTDVKTFFCRASRNETGELSRELKKRYFNR